MRHGPNLACFRRYFLPKKRRNLSLEGKTNLNSFNGRVRVRVRVCVCVFKRLQMGMMSLCVNVDECACV